MGVRLCGPCSSASQTSSCQSNRSSIVILESSLAFGFPIHRFQSGIKNRSRTNYLTSQEGYAGNLKVPTQTYFVSLPLQSVLMPSMITPPAPAQTVAPRFWIDHLDRKLRTGGNRHAASGPPSRACRVLRAGSPRRPPLVTETPRRQNDCSVGFPFLHYF